MLFAEFIQTLHGIVGKGKGQVEFTETILKRIVSKKDLIDYSVSNYKRPDSAKLNPPSTVQNSGNMVK